MQKIYISSSCFALLCCCLLACCWGRDRILDVVILLYIFIALIGMQNSLAHSLTHLLACLRHTNRIEAICLVIIIVMTLLLLELARFGFPYNNNISFRSAERDLSKNYELLPHIKWKSILNIDILLLLQQPQSSDGIIERWKPKYQRYF